MAAGTSPSVANQSDGPNESAVAFRGANGHLWTQTPSGGSDTGLAIRAGTSPSIVERPDGVNEIAFPNPQRRTGPAGAGRGADPHRPGDARGQQPGHHDRPLRGGESRPTKHQRQPAHRHPVGHRRHHTADEGRHQSKRRSAAHLVAAVPGCFRKVRLRPPCPRRPEPATDPGGTSPSPPTGAGHGRARNRPSTFWRSTT